jgi:catechol 2,3-dioxygenase-like lactoylglutathione lyase family enzyme
VTRVVCGLSAPFTSISGELDAASSYGLRRIVPIMFRNPAINIYSAEVMRLVRFYEGLGFRETFRTPKQGAAVHVEVTLDGFKIGIASVDAAIADHGLSPDLGGRPVEIVLWTDDTDGAYAGLTAGGSPSLSPPHDFLGSLRSAWVADPDGNPIQLVQHRKLESDG